jgi:hypothetical protein
MTILGEMDDRALGGLVGTIVIVGAAGLFVGQALWRSMTMKETPPPPPAVPPRE